ncbi:MAG: CRAL/TRIO domain-containing protein [Monoraphidium minutum]|nr:MAG: CRAL/TRIO domain-containing protein [Monoraphidium minutum]
MAESLDVFEALTGAEVELVQQLKAAVAPTVQKHPELRLFCNDWCYVRYLRARQWSLPKATKMLQATLQWRVEQQPHAITWAMVEAEAASGKNFVSPYPDREGRPVVTMRPRNQNTGDEKAQVQFLIYCLEHASRLADKHRVGKMTWLVDFVGYSMRNAPSVRTSVDVLHTLQNHYPERLGCAVCYCAPSLFSLTWRVRCRPAPLPRAAAALVWPCFGCHTAKSCLRTRTCTRTLALFSDLVHATSTNSAVTCTIPLATASPSAPTQHHLAPPPQHTFSTTSHRPCAPSSTPGQSARPLTPPTCHLFAITHLASN